MVPKQLTIHPSMNAVTRAVVLHLVVVGAESAKPPEPKDTPSDSLRRLAPFERVTHFSEAYYSKLEYSFPVPPLHKSGLTWSNEMAVAIRPEARREIINHLEKAATIRFHQYEPWGEGELRRLVFLDSDGIPLFSVKYSTSSDDVVQIYALIPVDKQSARFDYRKAETTYAEVTSEPFRRIMSTHWRVVIEGRGAVESQGVTD